MLVYSETYKIFFTSLTLFFFILSSFVYLQIFKIIYCSSIFVSYHVFLSVTPSYKEPVPGWVDSLNGPVGVIVAGGKGVIRSMLCSADYEAEVVPVDIAINALILIAWQRTRLGWFNNYSILYHNTYLLYHFYHPCCVDIILRMENFKVSSIFFCICRSVKIIQIQQRK